MNKRVVDLSVREVCCTCSRVKYMLADVQNIISFHESNIALICICNIIYITITYIICVVFQDRFSL